MISELELRRLEHWVAAARSHSLTFTDDTLLDALGVLVDEERERRRDSASNLAAAVDRAPLSRLGATRMQLHAEVDRFVDAVAADPKDWKANEHHVLKIDGVSLGFGEADAMRSEFTVERSTRRSL